MINTKILNGNSKDKLKEIEDNSIDLIITSPPYSDRRSHTYGGTKAEDYVDWFMPISQELLRTLKPDGTFILNIKEHCKDGERSTYVIELILALKKQGWLWTEEFIWHKNNAAPGKWPNRFRDAWERILQFNKTTKFNMYQDAVMVPASAATVKSSKRYNEKYGKDGLSKSSANGSGFTRTMSNWIGRDMVYPTNVLYMRTAASSRGTKYHSAVFPDVLPEWFLKLFSKENDTVLDPFAGSGTTLLVSERMRRNSIGVEILPEYCKIIEERLREQRNDNIDKSINLEIKTVSLV